MKNVHVHISEHFFSTTGVFQSPQIAWVHPLFSYQWLIPSTSCFISLTPYNRTSRDASFSPGFNVYLNVSLCETPRCQPQVAFRHTGPLLAGRTDLHLILYALWKHGLTEACPCTGRSFCGGCLITTPTCICEHGMRTTCGCTGWTGCQKKCQLPWVEE